MKRNQFFTIGIILLFFIGLYGISTIRAHPHSNTTDPFFPSGITQGPPIIPCNTSLYAYTISDIVLFSYADNASFSIYTPSGLRIWNGTLNEGEHHTEQYLSKGIYKIICEDENKKFSVLTGDPISDHCMGYYARDGDGLGASTTLYTYMPTSWCGREKFIVFSYTDGTIGTITDMDTRSTIPFSLAKGGHISTTAVCGHFVKVESNYPVSALSYGDQGYFVPSANQRFSGVEFYTYVGTVGNWPEMLHVMIYNGETNVIIKNSVTDVVYANVILDAGAEYTLTSSEERYYTILSNKDITVGVLPELTRSYAQGTYVPDRAGVGIGTEFYSLNYEGYLYPYPMYTLRLIAYCDNTTIGIYDTSGTLNIYHLNQGEVEKIYGPHGGEYLHILSDKPISVFSEGTSDALGSFVPYSRLFQHYPTIHGFLMPDTTPPESDDGP
jgi:hypothetical protein